MGEGSGGHLGCMCPDPSPVLYSTGDGGPPAIWAGHPRSGCDQEARPDFLIGPWRSTPTELRPATSLADALYRISDGSGREGQEHLICIASLGPLYDAYVSLCCLWLHKETSASFINMTSQSLQAERTAKPTRLPLFYLYTSQDLQASVLLRFCVSPCFLVCTA